MRFFPKISFLILLIVISFNSFANQTDTIKYAIKWLSPIPSWLPADSSSSRMLLNFENAKHNINGIPTFTALIPTGEDYNEVHTETLTLVFDTIFSSQSISNLSEFPQQFTLNTHIVKESKRSFIQISAIPAIRKNDKLLLVKGFTLKITPSRQSVAKKSSGIRWKSSSVLKSGSWKKIAVPKTGVYKITYAEIKNMGITNPSDVRIYGNGGAMLPERYSEGIPDDLSEIPLFFNKGTDGNFNEGDYIMFYATGPVTWNYDNANKRFVHSKHIFTDKAYYFITSASGGSTINQAAPVDKTEDMTINSFTDYAVHEENLFNLIRSGRHWYGEQFEMQAVKTFNFTFPDAVENSTFSLEGEVLSRSDINTNFTVKYNNQTIVSQAMARVYTGDETSNFADSKAFSSKSNITGKDVAISLSYSNNGDNSARGWLSYLRLNVKRKLKFNNEQLLFRDTTASGQAKTAMYTMENANSDIMLWDVTTLNNVKSINFSISGQQLNFKATTDTLRTFIAFTPAKAFTPDFMTEEENTVEQQNLHALRDIQMVIIAHPAFITEAEELAEIHRSKDNLAVATLTPQQIYNEFSSGNPDPAAFRNFMKMLYDNASTSDKLPKYLLLFGDGSYKNFSKQGEANTNLILTYQSANSIRPVSSYVSDDYFGLLDDNESIELGLLDIGIGRFPVTTQQQARGVLNKIKKYISAASAGNWRNDICFVADDEDGNIHMSQADQISSYVNASYPQFNTKKIYSDSYPQVTTSAGPRYPEVNKAIEATLKKGVLIMNYTGHGGEDGLAHEQILRQAEVKAWTNTVYPLFVTATCEFSRFDDFERTTAGEEVLLNENGGGIALLTTTRLVYSGPNFILNQEFYRNFIGKDNNGEPYRLGDILKKTKNASGTDINKLCFTLLGDPALRLAYPSYTIKTTQINLKNTGLQTDTIKAYQEITVKGIIADQNDNQQSGFNGIVYPSLFDKKQVVKTLNNDNGSPFIYQQQESLLFKGKATVNNGEFEFSFVVPREIAYNYGTGRLSYYANSNTTDAAGYFSNFIIGGISSETNKDDVGPQINLFLNNRSFSNGGVTNQFPVLIADLSDDHGINISGTGIGHDIIGILDNNTSNAFILNNYFESEINNYKNGTINFSLPKLEPGKHTISLKAWDIFNNSSLAEISFEVSDSSNLYVKNVSNYPNPFSGSTTFSFEHNQPGKTLDTELQIYSVAGNLIAKEKFQILSDGYTSGPILWNGANFLYKKLDRGLYIYRFIFRYNGQEIISESKKMIVSE